MADIRIRVELQRQRKGVELSTLSALADEAQKFLRYVAEDVGVASSDGVWVANDFYNQGVGFDAEYHFADVDAEQASSFRHAVDAIVLVGREAHWAVRGIRPTTVLQAARLAAIAGSEENVRLGLFNDGTPVEWRTLTKAKAAEIIEYFGSHVEYRGTLQGLIHSIYKEVSPPYFTLRDFASRELVHCEFKASDWQRLYRALERKDGVVFVSGWIRAKRSDRSIDSLRVETIQAVHPFDVNKLRQFFGSAPGWTGDLTTDQFIDDVRGDSDGD